MDNEINLNTKESESPLYSLSSWMTDLHNSIKHLKIGELSLPGAHNAGMDKDVAFSDSYTTCQDHSVSTQLDFGIRVLDLRFRWYGGYSSDFTRFKTFHSNKGGRDLGEIASAVDRFFLSNPGEIVILAVHKMEGAYDTNVPYVDFYNVVTGHFRERMLPRSAVNLTLEQIKAQYPGPRVIFATPDEVWDGRNKTYFWPRLQHKWVGSGLVSRDRLYEHIRGVMDNPPVQ